MRKHKANLAKPLPKEPAKESPTPLVVRPVPKDKPPREWVDDDFDNPLFACFKDILYDNDIPLDHPNVEFLKFIYMNGALDGLEVLKTGVPLDHEDPSAGHSSHSMYDLISEALYNIEGDGESEAEGLSVAILPKDPGRTH